MCRRANPRAPRSRTARADWASPRSRLRPSARRPRRGPAGRGNAPERRARSPPRARRDPPGRARCHRCAAPRPGGGRRCGRTHGSAGRTPSCRRPCRSRGRTAGSSGARWAGTGWSSATPLKTTSPVSAGSPNRAASSNVKREQPVTADAWRKPARSAARSVCDRSKMSASSMTVSPWRLTTKGIPSQRDSAVAYTPLGPKHCTCSTSGRNASAAARSSTSVRRPSDTTGGQDPRPGAGQRHREPAYDDAVLSPGLRPLGLVEVRGPDLDLVAGLPQREREVSGQLLDPADARGIRTGQQGDSGHVRQAFGWGSVPSMLCSRGGVGRRPRMICGCSVAGG